jgi:hypothetical protein
VRYSKNKSEVEIQTYIDKSSKKIDELKIRKMCREEAGFAVEMVAAEGWNPGIYDGKLKGYDVIRKCLKGYKT